MYIFEDLVSGAELLSDAYTCKETEDGFFYEVEAQMVQKGAEGISDALIGGNKSAEDSEEAEIPADAELVVNVVDQYTLEKSVLQPSSSKDFKGLLKPYLKLLLTKLRETDAERASAFEKNFQPALMPYVKNWKQMVVYHARDHDTENSMPVLLDYRPDGNDEKMIMIYMKDGLNKIAV